MGEHFFGITEFGLLTKLNVYTQNVYLLLYRMACIHRVSLIVNCGFARTSICRYSQVATGRKARQQIDTAERATKFTAQYSCCPQYLHGIQDSYLDKKDKHGCSQFDRDCNKVLDGFKIKWRGTNSKNEYLDHFSEERWQRSTAYRIQTKTQF